MQINIELVIRGIFYTISFVFVLLPFQGSNNNRLFPYHLQSRNSALPCGMLFPALLVPGISHLRNWRYLWCQLRRSWHPHQFLHVLPSTLTYLIWDLFLSNILGNSQIVQQKYTTKILLWSPNVPFEVLLWCSTSHNISFKNLMFFDWVLIYWVPSHNSVLLFPKSDQFMQQHSNQTHQLIVCSICKFNK